jgi:hypothetical protein
MGIILKDKNMEQEYKKVSALFIIPKSSDIKTVIGSLWDLYEVDRISEAVEDDPVMFIVEEKVRERKPEPEETIELGTGLKDNKIL